MYAARAGHLLVCKILLEAGAQNSTNSNGLSALDMAKNNGYKPIVTLLNGHFNTPGAA